MAPTRNPIAVAAALLAVIGTSSGVIAGRMVRASSSTETSAGEATQSPTAGRTVDGTEMEITPEPVASVARSSATAGSSPAPVTGCPSETEAAIGSTVTLVLYIETDASEVWICRSDSDDSLWYQGLMKSSPDRRYPDVALVEGTTAILLPDVEFIASEETVYWVSNTDANNDTTEYEVSAEYLTIVASDGSLERQSVTRHAP